MPRHELDSAVTGDLADDGSEADVIEQRQAPLPDDMELADLADELDPDVVEADPADLMEQHRVVPLDDDRRTGDGTGTQGADNLGG
jgi:hypothetical protein